MSLEVVWFGYIKRGFDICRVQSCVLRLPKYWPPTPPPSPPGELCPPPAPKAGGTHSTGGEGGGGSIFWKMQYIGLASYSNNLSTAVSLTYRSGEDGWVLLLAHIVSTCHRGGYRRGRWEAAPCGRVALPFWLHRRKEHHHHHTDTSLE